MPDPTEVEVPEALRTSIVATMARYPDGRSAALPALAAAQRVHGWCSPLAIAQVASVMPRDSRLPVLGGHLLRHAAHRAGRPAATCTCAPVWPATCATRREVYQAIAEEARDQGLEDAEVREFECLGACDMAPMASVDGRFVGPLDPSDAHQLVARSSQGREVLPGRGLEDSDYRLPWDKGDAGSEAPGA